LHRPDSLVRSPAALLVRRGVERFVAPAEPSDVVPDVKEEFGCRCTVGLDEGDCVGGLLIDRLPVLDVKGKLLTGRVPFAALRL